MLQASRGARVQRLWAALVAQGVPQLVLLPADAPMVLEALAQQARPQEVSPPVAALVQPL